MQKKERVLIAPLDWGLGHASRCVPLIQQKRKEGYDIVLAATGASADFFFRYFPELPIRRDIPAYRIHYYGRTVSSSITRQIPKLLSVISSEKRWLDKVIAEEKLDAVISDNRYGLTSEKIHSTLITHQIFPIVPQWARKMTWKLIHRHIHAFHQCLIPDYENIQHSLSGELSHGKIPQNCSYINPLSRFGKRQQTVLASTSATSVYDIVVLISGPEPYRQQFEKKMMEMLCHIQQEVLMICGQPDVERNEKTGNISLVHHLSDDDFYRVVKSATHIICRSGYSTIMDLEAIGKKALLIPTPGQTEQEYLAAYLSKKGYFSCTQEKLNNRYIEHYLTIDLHH